MQQREREVKLMETCLSIHKQSHLAANVFIFIENSFGTWKGHCFPTVLVETQTQNLWVVIQSRKTLSRVYADPDIWMDKISLCIIFNTLLLTTFPHCSLESMRTTREIEGSTSMLVFKILVWLGNNGVDTASFQDCFVSP